MRNSVIIFGAGDLGVRCLNKLLGWTEISFFCDNSKQLHKKKIRGIDIISFQQMEKKVQEAELDIILSVNILEMQKQLKRAGLKYWTFYEGENCYFDRIDVCDDMDCFLLDLWKYEKESVDYIFLEENCNWFRNNYISKRNRTIIENSINGHIKEYREIYDEDKFYTDEKYEKRPGMRLIRNILIAENRVLDICDIACGHGELMTKLRSDGHHVLGIEANKNRVKYLQKRGFDVIHGFFENELINKKFDVVIAQEILEHVIDVNSMVAKIKKILLDNGKVFITVPYGTACDCEEHVRYFTENKLASLFIHHGFCIVNIQRIPYLNSERRNGIIMEARL